MEPYPPLTRWRILAVGWPLVCLVFAAIVLTRPSLSLDERIAYTGFTLLPLLFFAIGMSMEHRLLRERRYATRKTTATVVSVGRRTHMGTGGMGSRRNYFPVFEFQAGEKTYQVKYAMGYSYCLVSQGKQVELYYAPDNPHTFYVPLMQKHDRRWARLLCGVGMVYPLAGLLAPWLRKLIPF